MKGSRNGFLIGIAVFLALMLVMPGCKQEESRLKVSGEAAVTTQASGGNVPDSSAATFCNAASDCRVIDGVCGEALPVNRRHEREEAERVAQLNRVMDCPQSSFRKEDYSPVCADAECAMVPKQP